MLQIVLPMAGQGSRFKKYGFEEPKFLIKVLGKTLLEYSLQSLPLEYAEVIILVMLEEHRRYEKEVKDILFDSGFCDVGKKLYIKYLYEPTRGQAETVYNANCFLDESQPLIIYNIDTSFSYDYDKIFKSKNKNLNPSECGGLILGVKAEGKQWSFAKVDKNGIVEQTAEKEEISNNALTGFYYFSRAGYFLDVAFTALNKKETSKGEYYVAPLYNYLIHQRKKILFDLVEQFTPLGTPQEVFNFIKENQEPIKARSFNKIEILEERQLVIKSSTNVDKLESEYNWLLEKKKKEILSPFLPDVYYQMIDRFRPKLKRLMYMERISYPSLSEIFLYNSIIDKQILDCIEKLFCILNYFKTEVYVLKEEKEFIKNVYEEKVCDRLEKVEVWLEENKGFNLISNFCVNGNTVEKINIEKGFELLKEETKKNFIGSHFHGDFCFPNILYDLPTGCVKLIDPRGDMFGDLYYDLAKLRHSLSGYDLIISGFYDLEEEINDGVVKFNFDIYWNTNFNKQTLSLFDATAVSKGYNIKKIRAIEILLFFTMIPLHSEDKKRQTMFLALALSKLNEFVNEK